MHGPKDAARPPGVRDPAVRVGPEARVARSLRAARPAHAGVERRPARGSPAGRLRARAPPPPRRVAPSRRRPAGRRPRSRGTPRRRGRLVVRLPVLRRARGARRGLRLRRSSPSRTRATPSRRWPTTPSQLDKLARKLEKLAPRRQDAAGDPALGRRQRHRRRRVRGPAQPPARRACRRSTSRSCAGLIDERLRAAIVELASAVTRLCQQTPRAPRCRS